MAYFRYVHVMIMYRTLISHGCRILTQQLSNCSRILSGITAYPPSNPPRANKIIKRKKEEEKKKKNPTRRVWFFVEKRSFDPHVARATSRQTDRQTNETKEGDTYFPRDRTRGKMQARRAHRKTRKSIGDAMWLASRRIVSPRDSP